MASLCFFGKLSFIEIFVSLTSLVFFLAKEFPLFPPPQPKLEVREEEAYYSKFTQARREGGGRTTEREKEKKSVAGLLQIFPLAWPSKLPNQWEKKRKYITKKAFLCLFAFYIFLCVRRMYLRSGIKGGKRNRGKVIRRLSIHSVLLFLHCLDATLQWSRMG